MRFTFSKKEAERIADAMLGWRSRSAEARGLINAQRYIYEVAGNAQRQGTPTPPGVCKHVPRV